MPKAKSVGGINDLVVADIISEIQKHDLRSVKVLDLGTAEGYNINGLLNYLEANKIDAEFVGVDIDTAAYTLNAAENIRLENFNLNNDFDFGKFDFVIATEVIEHVENPYHFMRHVLKNLQPNGMAFVSSPNVASLYSAVRTALISAPAFFENDGSREHITPVSSMTIKKALAFVEHETGERWQYEQHFTNNIVKVPTFNPRENHRTVNMTIPGRSRLLSQVSYYKISRAA